MPRYRTLHTWSRSWPSGSSYSGEEESTQTHTLRTGPHGPYLVVEDGGHEVINDRRGLRCVTRDRRRVLRGWELLDALAGPAHARTEDGEELMAAIRSGAPELLDGLRAAYAELLGDMTQALTEDMAHDPR